MKNELLLLSGCDIPFPIAQLTIHQPRIREISLISEETFWGGCQFIQFDKNFLEDEVKNNLSNLSNFNIIIAMLQGKDVESQSAKLKLLSVLALIFPTYKIKIGKKTIHLQEESSQEIKEINEDNFQQLKEILVDMFCLKGNEKQYDPSGDLAERIANQIKKGRQKRAELAPQKKISLLSRYVSILSVGLQIDINIIMDYTVYQLMDAFERFQLKLSYEQWERYKIAGATGMSDPEDWFKDIHDNNNTSIEK